MNSFIIFYDGNPIVHITNLPSMFDVNDILSIYSKHSGFDRSKLTWITLNKLNFNDMSVSNT